MASKLGKTSVSAKDNLNARFRITADFSKPFDPSSRISLALKILDTLFPDWQSEPSSISVGITPEFASKFDSDLVAVAHIEMPQGLFVRKEGFDLFFPAQSILAFSDVTLWLWNLLQEQQIKTKRASFAWEDLEVEPESVSNLHSNLESIPKLKDGIGMYQLLLPTARKDFVAWIRIDYLPQGPNVRKSKINPVSDLSCIFKPKKQFPVSMEDAKQLIEFVKSIWLLLGKGD